MKELWSDRIRNLVPYTPGEQPRDRKFIKLNTNENPYAPSRGALEAIHAAASDSLRLYPDPECLALRETLAVYHGLKPEQFFVGNGSDEVLAFCFYAFFSPGKPVLFPDITYTFYPVYADLYGLSYREIPLDEYFNLPAEEFLGGSSGGVVIANPNAPTGMEVSICTIRDILEANKSTVVIVDEAYVDFGARTAAELIDRYPNLVVVRTLSKARSMAGLRVGYAMGNADLMAALNTVKNSVNSYTVDRLAQEGARACVLDHDYFRATVNKIMNTRAKTANQLERMGFRVYDSSANFLFISHAKLNAKILLDGLREAGILVRWWNRPRIDNCLRVSIGTDQDMDAFCAATLELLERHGCSPEPEIRTL